MLIVKPRLPPAPRTTSSAMTFMLTMKKKGETMVTYSEPLLIASSRSPSADMNSPMSGRANTRQITTNTAVRIEEIISAAWNPSFILLYLPAP